MPIDPTRERLPAAWDADDRALFEPVARLRQMVTWWARLRRLWVR